MSSIKRLKSKGRATTGTPKGQSPGAYVDGVLEACDAGDPAASISYYDYRKAAFAALSHATTIRPMRIVKQRVQAAMEAVQRGLRAAASVGMDFDAARDKIRPQHVVLDAQLRRYKLARSFADAGEGKMVHALAR